MQGVSKLTSLTIEKLAYKLCCGHNFAMRTKIKNLS